MDTQTRPRIEPATASHLQAVTDLAGKWQLDLQASEISNQGFLMSGWHLEDYRTFLNEAEYFFVASHGTELAGFSVAYSQRHAYLDPWIHHEVARYVDEYMLHEQLCIAPEWAGHGVGTSMMSHLLQFASQVPVVSEIARYPLNQASAMLHKKLGYTPLADLDRPDGILTTLWISEPAVACRPLTSARRGGKQATRRAGSRQTVSTR